MIFEDTMFENKRRDNKDLEAIALVLRRDIIKSLTLAGSGHSGGPLGISDVVAALFFNDVMRYKADDPQWNGRDRFVLSSGHMAPVLYSALARAGYFPVEELATLRKYGSRLQGHPSLEEGLPGIETAAGSLGQGISIAVGMAMNDLLLDKSDLNVFCVTGDGELQEGSCWEAAMSAGNYNLSNLCWIVDNNDCQIDGRVKDVMTIYPLKEKFASFNFEVMEIDGNNMDEVVKAFDTFIERKKNGATKPFCIIAKTIMGQGVSFMADDYRWHGNPPKLDQAEIALKDLGEK